MLPLRDVAAHPRIDCKQNGFRFDAAKEQKLMLWRIKKIAKERKEGSRDEGLTDKLALLLGGELITQAHPSLGRLLFLKML